jgi:hypothetical protein
VNFQQDHLVSVYYCDIPADNVIHELSTLLWGISWSGIRAIRLLEKTPHFLQLPPDFTILAPEISEKWRVSHPHKSCSHEI